MKPAVWSLPGILVLPILVLGLTACSLIERKDPETAVPMQALPAHVPVVSKLELVQSSGGARLTPKGDTLSGSATLQKAAVDEIRENSPVVKASQRHPRVQEKLGHRYFFINAEPAKSKDPFCPSTAPRMSGQTATIAALTRVTYYSYSNTAAG